MMDNNLEQEKNQVINEEKIDDFRFGTDKKVIILIILFVFIILIAFVMFLLQRNKNDVHNNNLIVQKNVLTERVQSKAEEQKEKLIKKNGQIKLQINDQDVNLSDKEINVEVLLDTQNSNIVVASVLIKYDPKFLELETINSNKSVLSMAVIKEEKKGEIKIVRAEPGDGDYNDVDDGFTGRDGLLTNLQFKILKTGKTFIKLDKDNSKLILDDGRGTELILKCIDLEL